MQVAYLTAPRENPTVNGHARHRLRPIQTPSDPVNATPPAPDSVPGGDAIPTHQLKWRAVGGVVWLVSGTGVLALIKLPVVAILARLLSPAEFGVVAAAGTIIWLSAILSDLGVGAALVQRRDLTSAHVRTALTSAWMLGLALAGVIALVHYGFIRTRTREGCFRAFRHNNWVGGAIFAGIVVDFLLRRT